MERIWEPARSVPVAGQADVCVLGGSCTGVFAAVRAARLGARVILIERQNSFGGTAASGMVNTWTSLHDTERKRQIIGGLTKELIGTP
ncbi:MAG TPA: FAD-dependent oxidoreductase [Clostridia bacterium]|nr:FAD-dependent oxidoreductase [Clostridia bacterium]